MNPDPSTPSPFEDPNLQAAVHRAWGNETAPPELRHRVLDALAAEGLLAERRRLKMNRLARPFWRQPQFGLAAAAALVIGVALAAITTRHGGRTPRDLASAASLPTNLRDALVRRHDACLKMHPIDHHMFDGASQDNFAAIAQAMSADLHHPVIAKAMGHDWQFHGAGICPVGEIQSAHLVYARGDATISVFSLPASSALASCPDHQNCDADLNGHPLAGFVESGGFFCVVASSGGTTPIDAQQVKAMRDQLHGDVIVAAAAADTAGQRASDVDFASLAR